MKKAYLQPETAVAMMATDDLLNAISGVGNTAVFDEEYDDMTPTDTYLSRYQSPLIWGDDDEAEFE